MFNNKTYLIAAPATILRISQEIQRARLWNQSTECIRESVDLRKELAEEPVTEHSRFEDGDKFGRRIKEAPFNDSRDAGIDCIVFGKFVYSNTYEVTADCVLNLGDQIGCEKFFAFLGCLDLAVEVFGEESFEVLEIRGENGCLSRSSKL